jgi:hypothetical protein
VAQGLGAGPCHLERVHGEEGGEVVDGDTFGRSGENEQRMEKHWHT